MVPAMPPVTTWVVLTGKPVNPAPPISAGRDDLGRRALRRRQMLLAEPLAERRHDALVADHGAGPEAECAQHPHPPGRVLHGLHQVVVDRLAPASCRRPRCPWPRWTVFSSDDDAVEVVAHRRPFAVGDRRSTALAWPKRSARCRWPPRRRAPSGRRRSGRSGPACGRMSPAMPCSWSPVISVFSA